MSKSNDDNSLEYIRQNFKYHIMFTPKYRRKLICEDLKKIGKDSISKEIYITPLRKQNIMISC